MSTARVAHIKHSHFLKFIDISRPERNVYGLTKLPADLTWGRGRLEDTIVNPMTNVPITCWVVAEITEMAFKGRNGGDPEMVTVWGMPLMSSEVDLASDIVCKLRQPIQGMLNVLSCNLYFSLYVRIRGVWRWYLAGFSPYESILHGAYCIYIIV